jgi:hypothetical protein
MTTKTLTGRTITFRSGTEGPRHDPYGWREVTVETTWRYADGMERTLVASFRDGLGVRVAMNGQPITCDETKAVDVFKILTGMTPAQAEVYHDRARFRCSTCGNHKQFRSVDGYPGEMLYVCTRCESIVTGDFDRSVIE